MKHRIFPVILAVASLMNVAVADTGIEDVLVTGTYSPQPSLTSSVSVLDSQQIQTLNKRNLAGLLKTIPGVLVEEQGGPGGLTAVSIRGGEANFTVVLLDGVPVNDPTNFRGGGFDFANLNSSLVDRIEVVRGAQSAIYGSDALAGVINIITRRPQEGHNQEAYAEFGEDDFYNLGVSALGKVGQLEYTLEVASRDDGDPVPGSKRESDSASLRLGWSPAERHSVSASYRYLDGDRTSYPEQSGGPEYAASDELDESNYDEQVLALGWTADFTTAWRSTLTASRFEHDEDYSSPGIAPFDAVPPNVAQTDFTRDQLQWLNTLQIAPDYQVNIGADYRDEDGESKGYLEFFGSKLPTNFKLDRSTSGVFADVTSRPTDAMLLRASVRYDDPDDFDSETSMQAGVKYTLQNGLSFSGNWGEAYKLPSFFALGHALVGNPDLDPEQAESWDLGLTWERGDSLLLSATYFFNDFEDLIDFDDQAFINVNRKNVETSGVELQAQWSPLQALSLQSQATYTDLDVKDEDTVLTGRPEWTAGVVADWRFTARWSTVLDYRYTGEQWSTSRYTGTDVSEELDDFHRVDWLLRWRPTLAWQVQLSVDNLLDEDYETAVGFAAPERAFRFGVKYSN